MEFIETHVVDYPVWVDLKHNVLSGPRLSLILASRLCRRMIHRSVVSLLEEEYYPTLITLLKLPMSVMWNRFGHSLTPIEHDR